MSSGIRTVFRSGVGGVNNVDILAANSCKGLVLAYGVDIFPEAKRLAQNRNLKIIWFDKMQVSD